MSSAAGRSAGAHRWLTPVVLSLLAIHALLGWSARRRWIHTGLDDARYVMLARALRSGSYVDLTRVDRPPESLYPPGYPALLAAAGAVGGERLTVFAALGVALSAATLALVFLTVRRVWSAPAAVLTLAVLAVNPWLVEYAGFIASETAFVFWVVLTLYLLVQARERPSGWLLWGAAVAATIAALTRSAGVVLPMAVVGHWLLERRWKPAVALALASGLLVGGWQWFSLRAAAAHEVNMSYRADITTGYPEAGARPPSALRRVAANARHYAIVNIPAVAPLPNRAGTRLDNAAGAVVMLTLLAAGTVAAWRRARPALLFAGLYIALLLWWPYNITRFAIPLIPLAVPVALAGVVLLAGRFGRRTWAAALALVSGVLIGTGAWLSLTLVRERGCGTGREPMPPAHCLTRVDADYFAALAFLATRVPVTEPLLARLGATVYWYTGHRVTSHRQPMTDTSVPLAEAMRRRGSRYVLQATAERSAATAGRIAAHCGDLILVESFGREALLLRLREPGDASGDDSACRAIRRYIEDHPTQRG